MTASAPPTATPETARLRGASTAGSSDAIALYDGIVRHRRLGHASRTFEQRVSFVLIDVDELPAALDHLPLWSARHPALVRFRRRDYFDGSDRPLADSVRQLVADRTGHRPAGRVRLLTQLRRAGWLFNPMSVYYCHASDSARVQAIVLEVSNTPWNERCWYVVEVDAERPDGPWTFPKTMHVSPFLPMDLTYRLFAGPPAERLALRLEDRHDDELVFVADLNLRRIELDRRRALMTAVGHPLSTWRVSASIYGHAARLWARGAPIHRHPVDRCPGGRGGRWHA